MGFCSYGRSNDAGVLGNTIREHILRFNLAISDCIPRWCHWTAGDKLGVAALVPVLQDCLVDSGEASDRRDLVLILADDT